MIRRTRCDEAYPLRSVAMGIMMVLAMSPIAATAASPAPGSPLDANDVLVVSDSSTATVGGPGIARDAVGDFVVVWAQQAKAFPNPDTIHVQRFNAAGIPQGSAFQVDSLASDGTDFAANPSVAMDAAGDFVVAWQTAGTAVQETATNDVYARRYNAAGVAQGSGFQVNTSVNFDQALPSVAMDAAGDFVVTWQGQPDGPSNTPEPSGAPHHIYAQRYSAAGTAQGGEFPVSSVTSTDQVGPNVAMDAAGDSVVAWQTETPAGSAPPVFDILVQRYDAAGVVEGGEFAVSTVANTSRDVPHVAMDATGGFVVAWENDDTLVHPYTSEIHAERYDAAGTRQGSEFPVNTFSNGGQTGPSVAMDAAGDFTVVWQSFDQAAADSDNDVYAQRYSAAGAPVGGESLVNTSTENAQDAPSVAMDADGDMVVAWDSYTASTVSSIYVRRFAGEENVDFGLGATFAPATPSPGSSFSMTLAVTNISATTPTGVSSVDANLGLGLGITSTVTLPTGATYRSAQGTDWTCTGPVSSVLSCSYGAPLSAGNAASPLTIMLTAPSRAGSLAYDANVESDLKPDAPSTKNSTSGSVRVAGAAGSAGGPGGDPSGGSSSDGDLPAASSGGGALDVLSLAFLGLALLGRRKPRA